MALATLAWGLLAFYQHQAQPLIEHAKRLKPKKRLQFPFYSLLAGWQRLFADAKTVFYTWWRKKPDKIPINEALFPDLRVLS